MIITLHAQIEQASKEGLILVIGDMNIDFQKWENSSYYLKKLAEAYQFMIGECGLEPINFGITWSRIHKDGNVLMSSIDHGLTNKPSSIKDFYKNSIDYSDHNMVSVEMKIILNGSRALKGGGPTPLSDLIENPCKPSLLLPS